MATIRKIKALHFDDKNDPEMLARLNTLAPYMYRSVHDLARYIMTSFCDQKLSELNLTIDYSKSAQSAGAD